MNPLRSRSFSLDSFNMAGPCFPFQDSECSLPLLPQFNTSMPNELASAFDTQRRSRSFSDVSIYSEEAKKFKFSQSNFSPKIERDEKEHKNTVKRPPNPFILYRMSKQNEMSKKYPGMIAADICRRIAQEWRQESEFVKNEFREMSREVHRQHKKNNPNFKWITRSKNGVKKKSKSNLKKIIEQDDSCSSHSQINHITSNTLATSLPLVDPYQDTIHNFLAQENCLFDL